jgi:hypothetical protein
MKETDDDQDFQHGRHHRYDVALTAPANAQLLGGAIGGGWASSARWAVDIRVGATASVGQTLEALGRRSTVSRVSTAVAHVVPAIPNVAVRRVAIVNAGIAPITYSAVPAYRPPICRAAK